MASWIDDWLAYTSAIASPEIFKKWTGVSIVAGALERRVWIRTNMGTLFPNMYTILVGPPGVGKTVLTSRAWELWNELVEEKGHHLAKISVSKASLIDDLEEARRKIIRPQDDPPIMSFNSLKISIDELGVLIPAYENEFMNTLTHLWDGHPYTERKRTKNLQIKIDAPQLNILAGTTPSYLNNVLPEGAWDQGFLSRTILVFSSENIKKELFGEVETNDHLYDKLVRRLCRLGDMCGKMTFDKQAMEFLSSWHKEGGEPRPDHPKLSNYITRRTAHLLKLSMVSCAASSDDLVITLDNVHEALNWLIEVEEYMPDIFKAMTVGGDSRVIEEAWYHVWQIWIKEKKPVAENRIVQFIYERTPAHNVSRILEVMVKSGILENELGSYKPKPPRKN